MVATDTPHLQYFLNFFNMKPRDPVVETVNDLLQKSKRGKTKIKKTVSTHLGCSPETTSELLKAFEEISSDKNVLASMEANAEKKYGELGERMVELSIRNTKAMLRLREIAEEHNLKRIESRQQALTIIDEVFGSSYDYIDLMNEMVTIEETISKNKNPITRFFSTRISEHYRKKLEILVEELLDSPQ